MKRILGSVVLIGLLFSSLVLLTGCDNKKDNNKDDKEDLSQYSGTYEGQYLKLVGDTQKIEEEFTLELNEDGTGKHYRDGWDDGFDVKWDVKNGKFKMSETFIGDPIEYTGTIEDKKLDIFNGDPDNVWTYEYVYEKK